MMRDGCGYRPRRSGPRKRPDYGKATIKRRVRIRPDGRLFRTCSVERVAKIQELADLLGSHFGVWLDDKEHGKARYCRLDYYPEDPRWIRLFPYPRKAAFVAAFFIEMRRLSSFLEQVAALGLDAEEGKQPKSKDTERLRVHIPDDFDIQSREFLLLLRRLQKSYELAR